MKVIALNRKAQHTYHIIETFEAGIVLTGDEVKSVRKGQVSLADSFATAHDGQLQLLNCNITPYSHAYQKQDTSRRSRRLLLHKKEIDQILGAIARKGLTLIPLKLYLSDHGYVKVTLGLAKHKKLVEKKALLKERDIKREAERSIKTRLR